MLAFRYLWRPVMKRYDELDYAGILERVERNERLDPQEIFGVIRRQFAIANCAYVDAVTEDGTFQVFHLHHTFSAAWETAYITGGLYRLDPVFQEVSRALLPVDWESARSAHPGPATEAFFETARRHGIGPSGVTFPLISRANRTVLFSCEARVSGALWPSYRRSILSELSVLATFFHAVVQVRAERRAANDPDAASPKLTDREAEVLKWIAAGKSYWEIGKILGISERTVRFFMTNVRAKLDAVSNSQAVARAMVQRLVVLG